MKKELLIIAVALFAATASIVSAEDWPMFHHDLALSGYSTSTAPNTNDTLWIFNTSSDIRSSPAIADEKLYVGALNGKLYALDINTGSLIWTYQTGSAIFSSPAVAYGKVYILSTDGNFYALDANNGSVVWSKAGMGGPWSWASPAVHNGRVFIAVSGTGLMHSFDANTGAIIWNASLGGTPNSPITVANGKVYSGTHNFDSSSPTLVAVNETNGAIAWIYDYSATHPGLVGMINSNGAAVIDGDGDGNLEVYFGLYVWGGVGKAFALNEATGTEKWNYTFRNIMAPGGYGPGESTSTPAVHNGKIYIGSDDGYVYALNAGTGAKVWDFQTQGAVWSAPAVVDGKVFFGSLDHIFYALDETTGSLIWYYNTSQSRLIGSPAVAYGKVFVGNENGKIYAFGSKGSISGMKFDDLNGNGVKDMGEPGLANWTIILTGITVNISYVTVTNGTGAFNFTDLTNGIYFLSEVLQPGWIQTAPATSTYNVTITSGSVIEGLDFGNLLDIPKASCIETVNPAGKNVPPAGSTTLPGAKGGQNEDGFYQLLGMDILDPNPQVFVNDTGSGTIFGPFANGTRIKYTEANGATPSKKNIGGPNSAVEWHITGTGDAVVYAMNNAGIRSPAVLCNVPPPPK